MFSMILTSSIVVERVMEIAKNKFAVALNLDYN